MTEHQRRLQAERDAIAARLFPKGFPVHKVEEPKFLTRVAVAAGAIIWSLVDGLISAWRSATRDAATFCFCVACLAMAAYWIWAIATSLNGA